MPRGTVLFVEHIAIRVVNDVIDRTGQLISSAQPSGIDRVDTVELFAPLNTKVVIKVMMIKQNIILLLQFSEVKKRSYDRPHPGIL